MHKSFRLIKRYSLYILYNIIVIVAILLLFELLVRIFVPQIRLSGTSKNLLIDSLYFSSAGLRSTVKGLSNGVNKSTNQYHSWKYSKPFFKDKTKILLLGDSVTMGIGVENDSTFAGILNKHFDIINPSLIGYSSFDYVNVFNYFVVENSNDFKYKAVYIFWTMNDVYADSFIQNQPAYVPGDYMYNIVNFLRHNSKAYIFLKNIISNRSKVYYDFDSKFYTDENKLLKKSVKNIVYIADKCSKLKIDFCLFFLPYEYQARNSTNESFHKPQKILSKLLYSYGVKTIDCIGAFEFGLTTMERFYLYGDGIHFSKMGHRYMADFILNQLKEKNNTTKPLQ